MWGDSQDASSRYSVREGQGNVVVGVRKFGHGAATVDYATSDLSAIGGLDYQSRNGTVPPRPAALLSCDFIALTCRRDQQVTNL